MSEGTRVVVGSRNVSPNMGSANNEDRISNLPDCLISLILSCLPTKDAMRTSVLSKVWEYKWTSISKIDIDGCADEAAFANFVERLLLHALDLKSVRLECDAEQDSVRLTSWISALLRRKIETFYFTCECEGFVIPRSLLINSSLRKLNLVKTGIKVPARICFPNLRTLTLCEVEILNDIADSDRLILTLPVVETLQLSFCKWLKVKIVEIHARELTSFESETEVDAELDDYSISIIGDKLKEIKSSGGLPENISVTGLSVVKATLTNIDESYEQLAKRGLPVRKLLRGLCCLVKLELSSYLVAAMAKSRKRLPFPRFEKLRQLVLHAPVNSRGLLELLHAAPSLEFLRLDMCLNVELWDTYEEYEATVVPSCVVFSLEILVLLPFDWDEPQYHLAKFFLMNGIQLKEVRVFPHLRAFDPTVQNDIREKLSAMPVVSTCLDIIMPSVI